MINITNIKNSIYYRKFCNTWYGKTIINFYQDIISRDIFHKKLRIYNNGSLRAKKKIIGNNNIMEVGDNSLLNKVTLRIQGSNNRIVIGNNSIFGKNCRIFLYGNNLELIIGNGCTFSHDDELLVQEDNMKITIGNDCMFSHHINIRTSDAHPIYNISTNERSNPAKSINIGDHVWVGANVIIQKGSKIGNGCIIATYSVVNHNINSIVDDEGLKKNTIYAGIPAKAVKHNVYWKRSFSDNLI